MCLYSLCIIMTLGGVGGKVEPVAKPLKVDILPNALSVHSKFANATDSTVLVVTDSARINNVTCQLGSMEILLLSL